MKYQRLLIGTLIFIFLAGLCSFVRLDDDPLIKIKQQLDKWTNEQPVEKVYLHLDKPYYAAGDDIWFKAYVVSGSDHRLSALSGIVNIELIDQKDSIKQSLELQLDHGASHGDFALPDTLHAGNYHIRAYTNYMRNAGSAYFFNQAITIINPIASDKKVIAKTQLPANKIDVQFFPEGGDLVDGISTKVAFKAVDPEGLGADIKGTITDDKGQQAASFGNTHAGMGVFELTPSSGVAYHAKIIYPDGSTGTFPLPKVADKGYVLGIVDDGRGNLLVKVSASKSLLTNSSNQQLTLIAQSAGKIYYTEKTKAGSAVSSFVVPKSKFPSGIAQFTLFTSQGEPVNERLVFIRNPDQLNLTLTTDQRTYAPRQKVKITLDAQNANRQSADGNFSVSVTDETKVPVNADSENNILANLLLTSDLRGYVEHPAYYFNKPEAQTRADLDALMLTQGYHRFEWKQILKGEFPVKRYLPQNTLQVSGTVLTPAGKPVVNGTVKLFDLDSIQFARDTVTDERGRFVFNDLSFEDSVRFIVQARTSKNKKDVEIKMDNLAPESTSGNNPGFDINVSDNLSVYAQSSKQLYDEQRKNGLGNHVISLQEVIIREKKEVARYSSNLNGPGNADQIVQGKELWGMGCVRIADCLEGRLVGVIFRDGIPYSTRDLYRPMQLIVDGAYTDPAYINSLSYFDIQSIEILRSGEYTSIYGGQGGSGVFLVTTRRGGEYDYPEPIYGRGITTYYPKGYYKTREFYSPRYDNPKTNKKLADLRTTIFWQPDLITGKNGKTSFEYFNAGSKGNYRVVVEGIDNQGNIGRQVYHYQVR
ncbi:MAG TPA: TonB-dependent receptor [Mucilaginibacter sp.]|jgi:hypothetical protein